MKSLIDVMVEEAVAVGRHTRVQHNFFTNPARRWLAHEDKFLRENLGILSDDAIGEALGRTPTAVHLRWKRDLGLPVPSKDPAMLTPGGIAALLGVDRSAPADWMDRGLLPVRFLPMARRIRVVGRTQFLMWFVNPLNWAYFDHRKVKDPYLRRLLQLKRRRWNDAWWTTSQVG